MKKKIYLLVLFICVIGTSGALLMFWLLPSVVGINPDSTLYIGGAKSLLSGTGYYISGIPINHYPPLYSICLAIMGFFQTDLLQASRSLNAIFFGLYIGLIALFVYISAGWNYIITTLAVLFFISLAPIHFLYLWAWSEPLFILLTLSSIFLLALYIKKPTKLLFFSSSLCLGLVCITRYIGISFIPAAFVIVFFGQCGQNIGKRIRKSILWSMLACAPIGMFVVRNLLIAGSATNRNFVYHPTSQFLINLVKAVYLFLAPHSLPGMVRPVFFGLFLAIIISPLIIRFKKVPNNLDLTSTERLYPIISAIFSLSYILFLFISLSFFDASTPVDIRLMSPVFVVSIVGLFPEIWWISQTLRKPMLLWSFLLFVTISIFIQTNEAIRSAGIIQEYGLGNTSYTSQQWQDSKSIAFVKSLPINVKLYSNGSDAVGFLTLKQSLSIPQQESSLSMESNPNYNDEIDLMCKDIYENGALLVYFNLIDWRWNLPTQEGVEGACQLFILQGFDDGTIYGKEFKLSH